MPILDLIYCSSAKSCTRFLTDKSPEETDKELTADNCDYDKSENSEY